jgi:hypothetical protein
MAPWLHGSTHTKSDGSSEGRQVPVGVHDEWVGSSREGSSLPASGGLVGDVDQSRSRANRRLLVLRLGGQKRLA